MSFSAKIYGGDLETFLERSSLGEICNALYQVALGVEDGRASGLDFRRELMFALERACERGTANGRAIERQDKALAFLGALQATMRPPEGCA
jgi:hypothetical protein